MVILPATLVSRVVFSLGISEKYRISHILLRATCFIQLLGLDFINLTISGEKYNYRNSWPFRLVRTVAFNCFIVVTYVIY